MLWRVVRGEVALGTFLLQEFGEGAAGVLVAVIRA